jgi:hypothetical protein
MGQISSAEVRTLVHSTAHTLRKHKQACRGRLSKIEQGGIEENPIPLSARAAVALVAMLFSYVAAKTRA